MAVGGPSCSMCPAFITPTRSAIASASSWSWVTKSVVIPTSSCTRRISSLNRERTLASKAESGSSRRSTFGSIASARARHSLLLPARKLDCVFVGVTRKTNQVEHLAGPLPAFGGVDVMQLHPELHVLHRCHVREQRVGLEHHADLALVGRDVGDVLTRDDDAPSVGLLQSGQQTKRCGLAAAGRSEEGDELAGRHREAEPIERGHARVTTREVLESNLDPRARCGLDASGHLVPPEKSRPNVCTSRSRVRRRPPRCPPTNDSATSRTNAKSRDATATAIETPALVRPSETISTWRFG